MRNILVTGGCGYIGSHTVLTLIERGYFVYVLDSNINSNPLVIKRLREIISIKNSELSKNLIFIKGDLTNIRDIETIFLEAKSKGKSIKSVIHFAGLKSVEESIRFPIKYWENNLIGSFNLLKTMNKNECRNLIFSSSATIYDISSNEKIKEESPLKPINPYGKTKLVIEDFLRDIYLTLPYSWRIINLRYFNPIGAHYSGLLGESPIGMPNNIFPLILKVASKQLDKLKVFGDDWKTRDGTCIRDYIHINDLADGHIAAMEYLEKNKAQILNLNIGTGKGHTVYELIKTFENVNNIIIPYSISSRRDGDQEKVVADTAKILKTLKWIPKRKIEDMCLDGWRWQKNNPNGFS